MALKTIIPDDTTGVGKDFFAPYGLSPLEKKAIVAVAPLIEPALRAVGLTPQFKEALPIPGLYAIISGAGGGKSELCRSLDAFFVEHLPKHPHDVDYLFTLAGEPEDPAHSFEAVFKVVTRELSRRCSAGASCNPGVIIIDSFSDLAYQETPRAPRPDAKTITTALSNMDSSVTGVPGTATLIDLIIENSSQYLAPNSAALAGGLTGSYYQILKKISTAATAAGVYLFVVLNPLSFDDRGKFRDAVAGVVAAAISIDRQSAGLARCILPDSEGNYDGLRRTRRAIFNDRLAVTANDISDMMSSLLGGHNE